MMSEESVSAQACDMPCGQAQCLCCRPVCRPCCPGNKDGLPSFYAQLGVTANTASGQTLPFYELFGSGDQIRLEGADTIVLAAGYIYLIQYVFLATTEAGSYMQIQPLINGTMRLLYSYYAQSGPYRNLSASAGFSTNEAAEADARLQLRIDYPDKVRNIDISGAVSVTPVAIVK